jgi:putative NADPH-quinone reductase
MASIVIIDGHPDPDRDHFVHALAHAYAQGAAGRHSVERIDVATLDFPLLRSAKEWKEDKTVPAIAAAQEAILHASKVVIFYPLWLGDVPALLKGFLEQVFRPRFALGMGESGFPKRLLKGRSARIVVTMGMPTPFYRFFYRAHSVKSLERNILGFVGFAPIRRSLIGNVEGSQADRKKWLDRMRVLGRDAA